MRKGGVVGNYVSYHILNWFLFSEAEEHYKLPTSSYLGSLLCHHWRMHSKVEDACEYHNLSHISEQGSDFQTVIALGNLLATLSAGGLNESCKNRIKEVAEKTMLRCWDTKPIFAARK